MRENYYFFSRRARLGILLLVGIIVAQACGDVTNQCPDSNGEAHVASAETNLGHPVMLHVVGRACAGSGANTMRVYNRAIAEKAGLTSAHDEGSAGDSGVNLLEVEAVMPSMGHGTVSPIIISAEHGSDFAIEFQMPGEWQITVSFNTESTTAVETAIFAFEVFD